MAWNDLVVDGFDWSQVSFLSMYIAAANERRYVLGATTPWTVNAGDDVQSTGFINQLQSVGDGAFNWINLNKYSPADLHPLAGDPGSPHNKIIYTLAEIRTAAGLNPGWGFRRKRYREVGSGALNQPHDWVGNPATVGQRAIVVHPVGGNIGFAQYDGTNWVSYTPGPWPDVLDSELAAPNHIDGGFIQSGDFIGPWIWNQIRDAYNVRLITYHDIGGAEARSKTGYYDDLWDGVGNPPRISWEWAYGSAESDYAAKPWDISTEGFGAGGYVVGSKSLYAPYGVGPPYDGYTHGAEVYKGEAQGLFQTYTTLVSKTLRVYVCPFRPFWGEVDTPTLKHYFNPGSTGWTEGVYNRIMARTGNEASILLDYGWSNLDPPTTTHVPPDPTGVFYDGAVIDVNSHPNAMYPFAAAQWHFTYGP